MPLPRHARRSFRVGDTRGSGGRPETGVARKLHRASLPSVVVVTDRNLVAGTKGVWPPAEVLGQHDGREFIAFEGQHDAREGKRPQRKAGKNVTEILIGALLAQDRRHIKVVVGKDFPAQQ